MLDSQNYRAGGLGPPEAELCHRHQTGESRLVPPDQRPKTIMPIDLALLGSKMKAYREQFQASLEEVGAATGIASARLEVLERGAETPTGDEILIIADYYMCDYNYFLSGDQPAVFEQTQELYRTHGHDFSREDRWAVQEFLYVCECEHFLWETLDLPRPRAFVFVKRGDHFKTHGTEAAAALRRFMGYGPNQVPPDVFKDFRTIGLHIFRRRLQNSRISGLFVRHPVVGGCLLINYGEDIYRQRFTAAHEAAHAILDEDQSVVVSYSGVHDLREVRANTFASAYLLPPECLNLLPSDVQWTPETVREWAIRFKVNVEPMLIALEKAGKIPHDRARTLGTVRVARQDKVDPELPASLSTNALERVQRMLQRGLSYSYVSMCFDAYDTGVISSARMAEMLLVDVVELSQIAVAFGRALKYEA